MLTLTAALPKAFLARARLVPVVAFGFWDKFYEKKPEIAWLIYIIWSHLLTLAPIINENIE